jgi:type II secretory pathway component PulF
LNGAIELAAAVDRLAHGTGRARRAGKKFVAALEGGAQVVDALGRSGIRGNFLRFLETATPADLEPVLRELGIAVELARARSGAVSDAALYPLLLAGVSLLLGWFIHSTVNPSLAFLHGDALRLQAPVSGAASLVALGVSAAALMLLVCSLRSGRSRFPFAHARREHERALLLAGAATLARHGTPLFPGSASGGSPFDVSFSCGWLHGPRG